MVFIDVNNSIGIIIGSASQTTFGSMFATLMFLVVLLFAICLMFGIRLEYSAIILLPLIITLGSYYSEFIAMLVVLIIYISLILTKNFIFR